MPKLAGRPKKAKSSTIRFQAVLNRDYFHEMDAVEVAEALKEADPEKWTDRRLFTEGLIALGEKLETGWHPQDVPTTISIGADAARMLNQLSAFVQLLSQMDIDGLRQVKGFDENAYNIAKTGASKLISGDTKFDDKEDW